MTHTEWESLMPDELRVAAKVARTCGGLNLMAAAAAWDRRADALEREHPMQTLRKAAAMQPISKEALESVDHKHFRQMGLTYLEELGTVLEDTFRMHFIERAEIDGWAFPWGYELDGEWIEIPDDFVMARYEALVIPKEEA